MEHKFLKQFRISKPLVALVEAVPTEQISLINDLVDGFATILKQEENVADQFRRLYREERLFAQLLERELKNHLCREDDQHEGC